MTLRVYNTLARKKENFEPLTPGKVRMYVCGPTVYDSSHIGHARSVVVFDVIFSYLKSKGYDVTYVRNFTDVDDKIINRANALGVDPKEITDKYIAEFYEDMDALNVERATIEPRATQHINQMIDMIRRLMQQGFAYQINGDVYYRVEKFDGYGKLSGRKLEDMEAGARVDVDERKHNPYDFALWKSAKPGEPAWDSPWGKGRPGWHIECSVMSAEYLGETFDIHGGGKDLTFPHHENEIAQSEGASGKQFVKYWIHNGFVNIDQEKMSKSLGNFLLIKDVIKQYHPEAVRLFLLSNHYRSPIDFSEQNMKEAAAGLDKLYALLNRIEDNLFISKEIDQNQSGDYWTRFCEVMDDDFNTAGGIGILFEAVRSANRLLDQHRETIPSQIAETLKSNWIDIHKIGHIIGILREPHQTYFKEKKESGLKKQDLDKERVDKMIQARNAARKAGDWARADQIRDELAEMKIILEDRPEGTIWKIK